MIKVCRQTMDSGVSFSVRGGAYMGSSTAPMTMATSGSVSMSTRGPQAPTRLIWEVWRLHTLSSHQAALGCISSNTVKSRATTNISVCRIWADANNKLKLAGLLPDSLFTLYRPEAANTLRGQKPTLPDGCSRKGALENNHGLSTIARPVYIDKSF